MIPKPENTTLEKPEKTAMMQLVFWRGRGKIINELKLSAYLVFIFIYTNPGEVPL
jgi:hypothetical protein